MLLGVGMDAQVAYDFHHLRDEKPWLARTRAANKVSLLDLLCLFFHYKQYVLIHVGQSVVITDNFFDTETNVLESLAAYLLRFRLHARLVLHCLFNGFWCQVF